MLMNVQDKFSIYPQNNTVKNSRGSAEGKVKEALAKKYSNADVFVRSGTKTSSVGASQDFSSEKEYSIILDEDEMNLLASSDPKDRKAQENLYAQIDNAMNEAEKLGEEVSANDSLEDILQVGVSIGTDGKACYFAKTENNGFQVDSRESLMNTLLEKVGQAKAAIGDTEKN